VFDTHLFLLWRLFCDRPSKKIKLCPLIHPRHRRLSQQVSFIRPPIAALTRRCVFLRFNVFFC
jgi:hypothetical protein